MSGVVQEVNAVAVELRVGRVVQTRYEETR